MKALVKSGVVVAGYVAAVLAASAAVAVRIANTSGPDAQASAGMYALGDSLLFVAVFSAVALVPTGLALWFLRPYRWFCLPCPGYVPAGFRRELTSSCRVSRFQRPSDALNGGTDFRSG
jgi:hypothetical protein